MTDRRSHWLALARHSPLGLLLDLDGTLIPFAPTPDASVVDRELLQLLGELAALPDVKVAIVSGRPHGWLEGRLGAVPDLLLVAEHGGYRRGRGVWEPMVSLDPTSLDAVAAELRRIVERTPGALLERKTWSLTVHSRLVRPELKPGMLVETTAAIQAWIGLNTSFEHVEGVDVLELRPTAMRKSSAVGWVRQLAGEQARLLALGDDVTDEHLFSALGPHDEAVVVAEHRPDRPCAAHWRVSSPLEARRLLQWIAALRTGQTEEIASLPQALERGPRHASRARAGLVVISNRMPDLRSGGDPGLPDTRKRNVGGLVSALEPALRRRQGMWLGWSGRVVPDTEPASSGVDDSGTPMLAWLDFQERWFQGHYNGICNRALWPLFHTFPERVRFTEAEWSSYREVNEAFAETAHRLVGPSDAIWIHDYHLMLVGRALRQRGHQGPIGFFLHIPFPSIDVLAIFPWADELLEALLSLDLVAFHTPGYVANFLRAVSVRLGARVGDDVVEHRGRRTRVRAMPIGIFPESFQEPPEPAILEELAHLQARLETRKLVLGVDRLDYTKGIPERLQAFGRLMELHPEWRDRVSFVQVSVPSRADVTDYAEQRTRIENLVGRINGEYGEAHWVPIRYLYRSYTRPQLAQLYRMAHVGFVTPLRDGMNLVAKEYVAAQTPENPGALLLSELAGAAVEMPDAILTNPWHIDGMARDLARALSMSLEERRTRHARLLAVVERTTALSWAEDFLGALQ